MIKIKVDKALKCNGEYSMFITFKFDNYILSVVREFPDKYWHKEDKIWELPLKCLQKLTTRLSGYEIEITGLYVSQQKKKVNTPAGFQFKTKPFEHQLVGFDYGLNNDRWLLGDEMGLGKTKQVIDIACAKKLDRGYKHCLIICGVNGLKWNWKNEVAIHSNEQAYILGERWKGNRVQIGSTANKHQDVKKLFTGELDDKYFIITNIETLRDEPIIKDLMMLCESGIIGMIAFDECHKAKNPQSLQGKGVLKLQAQTMVAMTGTPLMNNPFDLFIILKWLGYEKHTFNAFKHHYGEFGGFGGYQVTGYKYLDELEDRLDEIMLRRRKEDVLDLPEKTYIEEFVDMTPKQRQVYEDVTADIKMHIDEIKMANNPLAELIRMRQATGYTGILSSTVQESAKLDRMEELVEEAISNGKKVVIFSNWTQITDEIYKRLHPKYHPAIITGQTDDAGRQDEVKHFQYDENCKVIIGTSGAMGTGLTLTAGTVEIFMDEPWNMALKEQCVDRCHRIGQQNNITVYTLMCKDTIDERVHAIVEKKGELANAIVDGIENLKGGDLLDFLLS